MHAIRTSQSVPALDLIVMAASAGGLEALRSICSALPIGFPAAIAIVQHRSVGHGHLLADLLGQWSALTVRDAQDGDPFLAGTILIAPPERHMTVSAARTVVLVAGPPIHHVLSSADPLFASAAAVYGARLTAIVLTGHDGDGSDGVRVVKRHGGRVIAQDPATAFSGGMPQSSIDTGMVDEILSLAGISAALNAFGIRPTEVPPEVAPISLDARRERPVNLS